MARKRAVLAGDIGGTKIDFAVYPVFGDRINEKALTEGRIPTEKGADGMVAAMRKVYDQASGDAKAKGYDIIAVAMGSPGRPIFERHADAYVVAPGSVSNMEKYRGELDGRDLKKIYQEGLPEHIALFIDNDAVVQMRAMLDEILKCEGSTKLYGNKVGYIGLGTGLGGGFATVDKKGNVDVHTDGHIYDIRLAMQPDMAKLEAISAALPKGKKLIFSEDDQGKTIRAEDVLSGSALEKMTGHKGKDIAGDPELFAQSQEAFAVIGRGLAELVGKIYKGEFEKIDSHVNWRQEDKDGVAGTKIFLLGGGVAGNDAITKVILDVAQDELHKEGIPDVKFIACREKNTTLAAASIVPQNVLRETPSFRR